MPFAKRGLDETRTFGVKPSGDATPEQHDHAVCNRAEEAARVEVGVG